jgi:CHAD domain-containing protein
MAKMWPVRGLDCSADFAMNARLVIAARIDELYSHERVLDHPEDAVGLHDMRISVKRLRYSLEFFAVCFDPAEVEWLLASLSSMQELLGDLHDADELVPHLHRVLGEVEEHRVLETDALHGSTPGTLESDEAPSTGYVPGVLAAIWRMREQREQAYLGARELWHRLGAHGLRSRLDRLAGRGGSFGETW